MNSLLPEVDDRSSGRRSRFEFRVWGSQDDACALLTSLAEREWCEVVDDWYLLLGSVSCNAKVRRNRLKIKRLVEERFGFQRWASIRHTMAGDGGSAPIDLLVHELGLDEPPRPIGTPGPAPSFATVVPALHVSKWRRRFELGAIRAEATEVVVDGHPERLTTLAIEGRDLEDLIRLRTDLGLDHSPNLGYQLALAPVVLSAV